MMFGFGGGSDEIEVDTDELRTAAITIHSVYEATQVPEGQMLKLEVGDVDDVFGAGNVVMESANSFFDEWAPSRGALLDNLWTLKGTTEDIADDVDNFDYIMSEDLSTMANNIRQTGHE
ncbi:hypothetical protein [Corynebacterium cystitidis]|uniref:hypothetical protein n=1 Tax=Corynebacterium cystitidis TaxID=35757 RepID=UPI00211F0AD2|nr:hypothetical protein [Corynebacterium cystitidis]